MSLWGVVAGGAAGAVARYAVSSLLARLAGAALPWGTLLVNVIGSLLLGVATTSLLADDGMSPVLAGLVLGGLGGFTTFSSVMFEATTLSRGRHGARAMAYLAASTVLSVAAAAAGLWIGGWR